MSATFPNLASFGILIIRDGEGCCYVFRADMHAELVKRGLWQRFCDRYRSAKRGYHDRGHFLAFDSETTIYELLTEGHP